MDSLPIEVIGNILSHLERARDVVSASILSKKIFSAARDHLSCLRFDSTDWPPFRDLPISDVETIITQTILQTRSLRRLSVSINRECEFSVGTIIAWLIHTRSTVTDLTFNVGVGKYQSFPSKYFLQLIERCGRSHLKRLSLGCLCIQGIDPTIHRLPSLCHLSLNAVTLSGLSLELLVSVCPRLELLTLIDVSVIFEDQFSLDLVAPNLEHIEIHETTINNIVLEAPSLKHMHLRGSSFESFELVDATNLLVLIIEDVSFRNLDIGSAGESFQKISINDCSISWTQLYEMIWRARGLKELRVRGPFLSPDEEPTDIISTISIAFPSLSTLSLCCENWDGLFAYFTTNGRLYNVSTLELGTSIPNTNFYQLIERLLHLCPRLQKLTISGQLSSFKTSYDFSLLGIFTTQIFNLIRKFEQVSVSFDYS